MKTLTITEGRGRLGYWLKKAMQGADVGFLFEGKIVALRPGEAVSADYALQEYDLAPEEMATAEKRIGAEIKFARKRGKVSKFTGDKNDFLPFSLNLRRRAPLLAGASKRLVRMENKTVRQVIRQHPNA